MALYARSNSLMFLVYMVIGFSATLGAILTILLAYYLYRWTLKPAARVFIIIVLRGMLVPACSAS